MADFTALSGRQNNIRDNEVILFKTMVTKVGNGYDPHTGIFTAEKTGIYLFYANIRTQDGNYVCLIDMVKNNDSI